MTMRPPRPEANGHDDDEHVDPRAFPGALREIGARQRDDELSIDRLKIRIRDIHANVGRIEKGQTDWQLAITRQLHRVTDQLQLLMISRIAWPGITAAAILFLGGLCAELVWRLATTH